MGWDELNFWSDEMSQDEMRWDEMNSSFSNNLNWKTFSFPDFSMEIQDEMRWVKMRWDEFKFWSDEMSQDEMRFYEGKARWDDLRWEDRRDERDEMVFEQLCINELNKFKNLTGFINFLPGKCLKQKQEDETDYIVLITISSPFPSLRAWIIMILFRWKQ